jgi:hypothetical protein
MSDATWSERFWPKVDRENSPNGCWLWTAARFKAAGGYGAFRFEGKTQRAHRVAYRMLVGPIPEGLVLDHRCREPRCVNPAHLEPVTDRVNVVERGQTIMAAKVRQTHCLRGHPLTDDNVWRYGTSRECKKCHAIRGLRRREKQIEKDGRMTTTGSTLAGGQTDEGP